MLADEDEEATAAGAGQLAAYIADVDFYATGDAHVPR